MPLDILRFVHLSDIHFSNRKPSFGFDPDEDIRNEIIRDIDSFCAPRGRIATILVTGDIAYSGKPVEYEDGAVFLRKVCSAAGCEEKDVLMCPGNHDVDQQVQRANTTILDSHEVIRRPSDWEEKESALTLRLTQPETAKLLYSPFHAYNDFAARFSSAFIPNEESYAWERDFFLSDGSILRIRALNTALLSGPADAERTLLLKTP